MAESLEWSSSSVIILPNFKDHLTLYWNISWCLENTHYLEVTIHVERVCFKDLELLAWQRICSSSSNPRSVLKSVFESFYLIKFCAYLLATIGVIYIIANDNNSYNYCCWYTTKLELNLLSGKEKVLEY